MFTTARLRRSYTSIVAASWSVMSKTGASTGRSRRPGNHLVLPGDGSWRGGSASLEVCSSVVVNAPAPPVGNRIGTVRTIPDVVSRPTGDKGGERREEERPKPRRGIILEYYGERPVPAKPMRPQERDGHEPRARPHGAPPPFQNILCAGRHPDRQDRQASVATARTLAAARSERPSCCIRVRSRAGLSAGVSGRETAVSVPRVSARFLTQGRPRARRRCLVTARATSALRCSCVTA